MTEATLKTRASIWRHHPTLSVFLKVDGLPISLEFDSGSVVTRLNDTALLQFRLTIVLDVSGTSLPS